MAAAQPLLHHTSTGAALAWLQARGARALAADSRRVGPGTAFLGWPGAARDGRAFASAALGAGAPACLVEADGVDAFGFDGDERIAAFGGLKAAAGPLASAFHAEPSQSLDVIAVTGTNGKTSTTWWIAQALAALGRRCGVVGTLGVGEPPRPAGADATAASLPLTATGLTTPDALTLQATFRAFVDAGLQACAIEASSIGIVEEKLTGTRLAVAVYTNFTRDHLDYHGSMAAYWAAKARLFAWPGLPAAVLNIDDAQGEALATTLAASRLDLWTTSLRRPARLQATGLRYVEGGLACELVEAGLEPVALRTALIGDYNAHNLLGVIAALRALGVPLVDAAAACSGLTPVPGRMQRVAPQGAAAEPDVVVDYAHTPDALEKALIALRPFATARGGRLWCVFGCGGNRDQTKRPLMGAIAERLADHVVVTSDNPRDEAPCFIVSQVLAGVVGHDDVDVYEDRAEAIAHAVSRAAPNDVVLIAGKGHEDTQEVRGVKRPFLDADVAATALRTRVAAE